MRGEDLCKLNTSTCSNRLTWPLAATWWPPQEPARGRLTPAMREKCLLIRLPPGGKSNNKNWYLQGFIHSSLRVSGKEVRLHRRSRRWRGGDENLTKKKARKKQVNKEQEYKKGRNTRGGRQTDRRQTEKECRKM